MLAPRVSGPAVDRYARAMQPCCTADTFDRARAHAAITALVRELEAAGERPADILRLAVELLPFRAQDAEALFAISFRDWVRTTTRETLRGSVLDRRSFDRAALG